MVDEINFVDPETLEPVSTLKEEERPKRGSREVTAPPREVMVRSAWGCAFGNLVLVYVDDDYRLMAKVDWPRAMKFTMPENEFKKLPKPQDHTGNLEENIVLWKNCKV